MTIDTKKSLGGFSARDTTTGRSPVVEVRIAKKDHGEGVGAETVQQKGLRLYRSGSVKHLHGDKYLVTGDHGTYKVDNLEDTCGLCLRRI